MAWHHCGSVIHGDKMYTNHRDNLLHFLEIRSFFTTFDGILTPVGQNLKYGVNEDKVKRAISHMNHVSWL